MMMSDDDDEETYQFPKHELIHDDFFPSSSGLFPFVPVRPKTQMSLLKRHSGLCRLKRRLTCVCVLHMCVSLCVCVYVCV